MVGKRARPSYVCAKWEQYVKFESNSNTVSLMQMLVALCYGHDTCFFIRNLAQGLILELPYFRTSLSKSSTKSSLIFP